MPDAEDGGSLEAELPGLFALEPGDFVAARDDLAARARTAGDRPLSARVKALRRPTVSAWVVNLLAREETDSVGDLVDLGEALRAAHQTLSADELRPLAAQRTAVVEALTRRAAALAAEHGHPTTEAVRAEVAGTLQAALADPDVAEDVRAGRMTRAASYSGFGMVSPGSTRPRQPEPVASLDQARSRRRTREEKEAEQARIRAFTDARRALETATAAAEAAEDAAASAEDAHREAAEELDRRSQEVADLRAELEAAEAAEEEARTTTEGAREALDRAADELDAARAAREEAEEALDALGDPSSGG
ncbi:hypothetical protein [Auraticoccus monumenti]|uniref:Uncharacterized protein n=1 Tax=Auraticoccus monumenti TaxID=675864 RepID=A0A1G6SHA7_9ACTN|nr:hypothetical protein [Auraticoccus monumenti]SDD15546.1 hypothetical protein SAMN04489747_0313 [Auraticoccus monumenti]